MFRRLRDWVPVLEVYQAGQSEGGQEWNARGGPSGLEVKNYRLSKHDVV